MSFSVVAPVSWGARGASPRIPLYRTATECRDYRSGFAGFFSNFVTRSDPEWHEVKEYFGRKSSFGISDLHHLNLHLPPGRAASRGRFRSKGRSSQTRLNFVPFRSDPGSSRP